MPNDIYLFIYLFVYFNGWPLEMYHLIFQRGLYKQKNDNFISFHFMFYTKLNLYPGRINNLTLCSEQIPPGSGSQPAASLCLILKVKGG